MKYLITLLLLIPSLAFGGNVDFKANKDGSISAQVKGGENITLPMGKTITVSSFIECDSTPVVSRQYGFSGGDWMTLTWTSAGLCTLVLENNSFSSVEDINCVCSDGDGSGSRDLCRTYISGGILRVAFYTSTTGALADSNGVVMCQGKLN